MTNLAKMKRLYLWKPSICKTFWTTLNRMQLTVYLYQSLYVYYSFQIKE